MQFAQLLALQSGGIEGSIIRRYADHCYGRFSGGDRCLLDLSEARIRKQFSELGSLLQARYIRAIEEHYCLTRDMFKECFGAGAAALEERGFYLWNGKIERYVPPIELVRIFAKNSLTALLLSCAKDDLLRLFPDRPYGMAKVLLVERVVEECRNRFNCQRLTDGEFDRIDGLLRPFQGVLDGVGSRQQWRVLASDLRVNVKPEYKWPVQCSFEDYIRALEGFLSPLFKEKLIFLVKGPDTFALKTNPMISEALAQRVVTAARETLRAGLAELKPVLKTDIAVRCLQFFHFSDDELVRLTVLMLAWLESERIGLTRDMSPRVVDLKRLSKLVAVEKWQQGLYEQVLAYIFDRLFCADIGGRADRGKSRWQALAELPQDELLKIVRDIKTHLYRTFLQFIETLPKDVWISVVDIRKLFKLYCTVEGLGVALQLHIEEFFPEIVFHAQVPGGRIDAVFPKGGARKGTDYSMVEAVRVVSPQGMSGVCPADVRFTIQGNLEMPIPADISPSRLFMAAQIFDLQDKNTLKLTEAAAINFANGGSGMKNSVAAIREQLDNDLPPLALKLLERVFKDRVSVYYNGRCLYLYNPAALSQVKALIPASRIVKVVDERLVVLEDYGRHAEFVAKLKKNNISVELGCTEY